MSCHSCQKSLNQTTRKLVTCPSSSCGSRCCMRCHRDFLEATGTLQCLHCLTWWDDEVIRSQFTKKFAHDFLRTCLRESPADIIREQDEAYEESLRLDAAREQEKQEAERREREALEAQAREAEEKVFRLEALAQALPPECEDSDSITLQFQTPVGKYTRCFPTSSATLEHLYDFVTVTTNGEIAENTFELMRQYPREVLPKDGTALADAGFHRRDSVFVHSLTDEL